MAKKRLDKNCVEINVCVDLDLETEIIKKKHTHIANTGQENYRKSDAASDYFRELYRMVKGGEK